MAKKHDWLTVTFAGLSALAAFVAAGFSGYSALTAQRALESSEKMSLQSERTELFLQFQEQYNAVSARFPEGILPREFRPKRGSNDYARLEAYWFFCFSEWYATNRVNEPAFRDLWVNYYTPLIADGLEIPSLRHVLEDRIRARGAGRGAWKDYLKDLASIARRYGHPLSKEVEEQIFSIERTSLG